jgi:hypothetical protein
MRRAGGHFFFWRFFSFFSQMDGIALQALFCLLLLDMLVDRDPQ